MVKTIHSEIKYEGIVFSVRQDRIRLPNGKETYRDIVDHVEAVTILPIDAEDNIWFIRQYRHAVGGEILELPAGILEHGEDPYACARREAREEIGMAAGRLQKLGEFYMTPGYSTEYMYVYLATELSHSPLPCDDDEILTIESIPLSQVMEMVREGHIRDAKTLAALLLAIPEINL
ncbi:MAG: NUDIX hydrolase [Chloroflexota bacterium]|nr:NUDIX hydrolase [Chloroflexota bacterium]